MANDCRTRCFKRKKVFYVMYQEMTCLYEGENHAYQKAVFQELHALIKKFYLKCRKIVFEIDRYFTLDQ
jgi:hypothetical protein